jgi:hypothetical protein
MKKLLVEDIYKAVMSERDKEIIRIMDEFDVNEDEAEYLYDNYPNDSDKDEAIDAADQLNTDLENIEDDDIEAKNSEAGIAGEINTSMGTVEYFWDVDSKEYFVHMEIQDKDDKYKDLIYIVDNQTMDEWSTADSAGEYYNENVRGNIAFEDPINSCGCAEDPCTPDQIDQFRSRYSSLI